MKKFKNIIFDLGNVLFPISEKATLDAFAENGVDGIEDKYNLLIEKELFLKFEAGAISNEDFRKELNTIFGSNLDDETFDRCWNAMIVSYSEKNNPFLEKLKADGYNLYILSNTNAIHVEYLKPMAGWRDGLFTKIYYSNEIHLCKPGMECYEYVLNDAKIKADETIFIDDRPQNIEGAQKCGIHTLNLLNIEDLYQSLEDRLK